jgi:hypothetical protein
VYKPVARGEILDALVHIRNLHRQADHAGVRDELAVERREIALKHLLSNLPRTSAHPTLRTVLEIADLFSLTLEGAHGLFGYDLTQIGDFDLRLNRGRTHIVESYGFDRDLTIDLPLEFAPPITSDGNRMLRDVVRGWQTGVPFRALQFPGWSQPGTFYVHVGTEDSLGSSLPPGSLALVEPIDRNEQMFPNPRAIYLLQFSNGYRCSRCVVSRGRLQLLTSERAYRGPQEFRYPSAVRIAGRVRMFTLALPLPEYRLLQSFPLCTGCARLVLPWEHHSRSELLAAKHKRFHRSKNEERMIREQLRAVLGTEPSGRTERRYRKETASEPHIHALLHLTLANLARYTDSIQTGGFAIQDKGRFSLETLLDARHWDDVLALESGARLPRPSWIWEAMRREFIEWPPMLSLKFPELSLCSDRIVRLGELGALPGLEPPITAGSWMLLEMTPDMPDLRAERRQTGWSRSIHALQRGVEIICGYLERDGEGYALMSSPYGRTARAKFQKEDVPKLRRVVGVAVPV